MARGGCRDLEIISAGDGDDEGGRDAWQGSNGK